MARYEAGETLASIARTYDCSPPAISYIVSRSRARPAAEAAATTAPVEPQLIKAAASAEPAVGEPAVAVAEPAQIVSDVRPHAEARPPAANGSHRNGAMETAAGANGEARRTLHLSLGNGSHSQPDGRNGGGSEHAQHREARPQATPYPLEAASSNDGRSGPEPIPGSSRPPQATDNRRYDQQFASRGQNGHHAPQRVVESAGERRTDVGSFIDQELRTRVDGDIAVFLAAFDAALAEDTQESRFGLREATDRLLRAGARTRIELERLEARLPLPPRDGGRPEAVRWRPR